MKLRLDSTYSVFRNTQGDYVILNIEDVRPTRIHVYHRRGNYIANKWAILKKDLKENRKVLRYVI